MPPLRHIAVVLTGLIVPGVGHSSDPQTKAFEATLGKK